MKYWLILALLPWLGECTVLRNPQYHKGIPQETSDSLIQGAVNGKSLGPRPGPKIYVPFYKWAAWTTPERFGICRLGSGPDPKLYVTGPKPPPKTAELTGNTELNEYKTPDAYTRQEETDDDEDYEVAEVRNNNLGLSLHHPSMMHRDMMMNPNMMHRNMMHPSMMHRNMMMHLSKHRNMMMQPSMMHRNKMMHPSMMHRNMLHPIMMHRNMMMHPSMMKRDMMMNPSMMKRDMIYNNDYASHMHHSNVVPHHSEYESHVYHSKLAPMSHHIVDFDHMHHHMGL